MAGEAASREIFEKLLDMGSLVKGGRIAANWLPDSRFWFIEGAPTDTKVKVFDPRTKSVSDLYSPVTGEVTEINEDVVNDPALVNSAPFEGGWLFKVRVTEEPADLLSADEYDAHTAG